jgi:aconitase A
MPTTRSPRPRRRGWGLQPLPAALKVVLENMLRFEDGKTVTLDDIKAFSLWAERRARTRARSPIARRAC